MPNVIETTDAAATSATTYVLTPGQTASGTLATTTDQDGFRVTLQAGQTYTFSLVGTGPNGVDDTLLNLLGPNGAVVASDDDGGNGRSSQLTFTATQSGTYVVVATSFQNSDGGETGTYGLSVTAGTQANYDTAMGAGAIQTPYSTWGGQMGQPATVTWAARSTNANQSDSDGDATPFIRASSAQIAAFTAATAAVSEVSGLTFTRVGGTGYSNSATILVGAYDTEDAAAAYAAYPGSTLSSAANGDVSINNNYTSTTSLPRGSYDFITVLHELGHAVGLAHPGEYNAEEGVDITYEQNALFLQDSSQFTIMSYFDEDETTGADIQGSPDTLLMFDILALQNLYGANMTTRAGNSTYGFRANTGDVYDFAKNTSPFLCIWDGGGVDKINASGYSNNQLIDLRAGYFSNIGQWTSNVAIAIGAVIENAIGGSGRDELTGNAANNVLDGRGGADLMRGGAGDDTFYIENVGDVAREAANEGVDTIIASVDFSIGANFENLMLGAAATNAAGNGLNNIIVGNGRNNTVTGNRGADTLSGKNGADTFDYNNTNESTVSAFDRITDLTNADRIDLSGVDARTDMAGNNAFNLVDAFTGVSGQMTAAYSSSTGLTTFLLDVNGDRAADMKIVANGDHDDFTNFVF